MCPAITRTLNCILPYTHSVLVSDRHGDEVAETSRISVISSHRKKELEVSQLCSNASEYVRIAIMRPGCEHRRPHRALSKHICNVILRVPNTRSSSTLNEYISVEGESSSGCSPELSSTSYSSGEYFNLPSVVVHSRSILVTPRAFPASRRWVFGPLLIALRRHYILSFTYPHKSKF